MTPCDSLTHVAERGYTARRSAREDYGNGADSVLTEATTAHLAECCRARYVASVTESLISIHYLCLHAPFGKVSGRDPKSCFSALCPKAGGLVTSRKNRGTGQGADIDDVKDNDCVVEK